MINAVKLKNAVSVRKARPKMTTSRLAQVVCEAVEPRRLLAFTPSGAAGTLITGGTSPGVESAAGAPDGTNQTRYATVVNDDGTAYVIPVTGATSANPGTAIALPTQGGTISTTDVAAGTTSGTGVVTYQTSVTSNGITTTSIYAVLVANGALFGSPVQVASTTTAVAHTRVAQSSDGSFLVVWTSGGAVHARGYSGTAAPAGAAFTVAAGGGNPDVAVTAPGQFVVTWSDASNINAQKFTTGGTVLTTKTTVVALGLGDAVVGGASDGSFVVAWSQNNPTLGINEIYLERFNSDGTSAGAAFTVESSPQYAETAPEIAFSSNGQYAVGWIVDAAGSGPGPEIAFEVFNASDTVISSTTIVAAGTATFGAGSRFGLAYGTSSLLHVAYGSGGSNLMQTYSSGGGGGTVVPTPPSGSLQITVSTGSTITVSNDSTTITVVINGVTHTYSRSSYSSVFIVGSNDADFINESGLTISSQVYAQGGNDTIYGGSAADTIDAGDGDDAVQANGGDDYVYGGDGNDTLYGAAGNDRILGGPGKNVMYGEDGFDTLIAGNRGDVMYGGSGGDSLVGGSGGDYMDGGASNDTLEGNDGNDVLIGGNGNDLLEGGAGNDSIVGGRGMDSCFGNDGNDTLVGGADADILRGGGSGGNGGFNNNGRTGDYAYYDTLDTVLSVTYRIEVK